MNFVVVIVRRSNVFSLSLSFLKMPSFIALFQFIIMVIDSTDRERLAVTREELYTLLQHEDLSKACLLVYANKQVSHFSYGYFSVHPILFRVVHVASEHVPHTQYFSVNTCFMWTFVKQIFNEFFGWTKNECFVLMPLLFIFRT